jgi:hypothetical protein
VYILREKAAEETDLSNWKRTFISLLLCVIYWYGHYKVLIKKDPYTIST